MTHIPTITFKRGDNFKLDITVTDPNNDDAEAALIVLTAAEVDLVNALALLAFYEAVIPPDQQDIDDQQIVVDTATTDLATAQGIYDAAIIVDITGWTITSSLRWCGRLVETMEITITNASLGTLNIRAYEIATVLWDTRKHDLDIVFTRDPEGSTSSETMIVDVQRGATNG